MRPTKSVSVWLKRTGRQVDYQPTQTFSARGRWLFHWQAPSSIDPLRRLFPPNVQSGHLAFKRWPVVPMASSCFREPLTDVSSARPDLSATRRRTECPSRLLFHFCAAVVDSSWPIASNQCTDATSRFHSKPTITRRQNDRRPYTDPTCCCSPPSLDLHSKWSSHPRPVWQQPIKGSSFCKQVISIWFAYKKRVKVVAAGNNIITAFHYFLLAIDGALTSYAAHSDDKWISSRVRSFLQFFVCCWRTLPWRQLVGPKMKLNVAIPGNDHPFE